MSEEQLESLMNQAEDLEKRQEYDRAIAILEQARAIAYILGPALQGLY